MSNESSDSKAVESYRHVLQAGAEAIKIALLINGGAATALLAFLSSFDPEISGAAAFGLSLYAGGVGAAAIAAGMTYFSQCFFQDPERRRQGERCRLTAIIFWALSIACFVVGSLVVAVGVI